ncbi:MAG: hypothetical protein HXY18_14955 [Bryobacteraceae bacterium]|nr:hypothetical protein [Bryobacteraceae bacterium]
MARISPLWFLLPVQAVLLFWNPGLLPVWTDELFTLGIAPRPLGEIVARLAKDIHPPLYYFQLHLVSLAAGASVEWFRAVSAAWALGLTALMDRLWVKDWAPAQRWVALSLVAFSPCLLLYGRMARSYSMQAALALLAVWAMRRWLEAPSGGWRKAAAAALAAAALLYAHYVPGLAILGGFAVAGVRRAGWIRWGVFMVSVLALYAPWLWVLAHALSRWGAAPDFSSRYMLTGSFLLEHLLKLGFGWTSLAIGESFPAASLALAALLLAVLVLGLGRAGALSGAAGMPVCAAALLGYIAVSRWVSYPFTPARLLWLLPFLAIAWTAGLSALRPPAARWTLFAAVILSHAVSAGFYFERRGFLNPGYSAPLREITARINAAAGRDDLVLMDGYNTDHAAVAHYLRPDVARAVVNAANEREVLARSDAARDVWVVRNARDISPGGVSSRAEEAVCRGREASTELWHPLPGWQRLALRLLSIPGSYSHFYRVTSCRAPG